VIEVKYNPELNEFNILENYSEEMLLFFNDNMMDLNNPITIKYKDEIIYQNKLNRTILNIYHTLLTKGDFNLAFPCVVLVKDNQSAIEN
jgi:hypothetical protein